MWTPCRVPVSTKFLRIPMGTLLQWICGPGQPGMETSQDTVGFCFSANMLWKGSVCLSVNLLKPKCRDNSLNTSKI